MRISGVLRIRLTSGSPRTSGQVHQRRGGFQILWSKDWGLSFQSFVLGTRDLRPIAVDGPLVEVVRREVNVREALLNRPGPVRPRTQPELRPVVLEVRAAEMVRQGFTFFWSPNGVWLVDHVPPCFLSFP